MSENNHRKCAKCGKTRAEDMTVTYHRFPKPGSKNITKAHAWAKYCWPNQDWSSVESLQSLHISNKVEEAMATVTNNYLMKYGWKPQLKYNIMVALNEIDFQFLMKCSNHLEKIEIISRTAHFIYALIMLRNRETEEEDKKKALERKMRILRNK